MQFRFRISFTLFCSSIILFGNQLLVSAQEQATETQSTPATTEDKQPDESEAEADDLAEVLAGHSYHGNAFNEGPRQKAYLMGGTGNVHFRVCPSHPVGITCDPSVVNASPQIGQFGTTGSKRLKRLQLPKTSATVGRPRREEFSVRTE